MLNVQKGRQSSVDYLPSILSLFSFLLLFQSFWIFSLLFSTLCPFSPAQVCISLSLHNHFGLFPCFSRPYVHFHLLSSVFPSSFTFILDFFPAFLCFMSILTCSVQYFTLASRSFWTFFLLFFALCPFSPAQFSVSLWLHVHFGLFSCFSRPYVHSHLLSSVFPSGFTTILDFFLLFSPLCPYGRIWKGTEGSVL